MIKGRDRTRFRAGELLHQTGLCFESPFIDLFFTCADLDLRPEANICPESRTYARRASPRWDLESFKCLSMHNGPYATIESWRCDVLTPSVLLAGSVSSSSFELGYDIQIPTLMREDVQQVVHAA